MKYLLAFFDWFFPPVCPTLYVPPEMIPFEFDLEIRQMGIVHGMIRKLHGDKALIQSIKYRMAEQLATHLIQSGYVHFAPEELDIMRDEYIFSASVKVLKPRGII